MKKKLLILFLTIFSITIYAQQENEPAIVLELFTSQGCSSCPPADDLLEEIREEYKGKKVFVLSYHVDYWNRLGWKDPFSDTSYSDYQRIYGQQFNSRSIYTPQLVVNGSEHFTGSNRYKADVALKKYSKSKANNVIVISKVKKENDALQINYTVEGDKFNTVTLALIVSERSTAIPRGENRNRTLKNANIVAGRIVTKQVGGNVSIQIPDWVNDKDQLSVIAYTQDVFLKTTGATQLKI